MGWKSVAAASIAATGLLGVPGCAQVWGLDTTSSAPDTLQLPPMASLTFQRMSIGSSIIKAPADLTGQTAHYLVPDTNAANGFVRIPATMTAAKDAWTAEVPEGVAASVEFTVAGDPVPYRRLWTFPNRDVVGLLGYYEHPNMEVAPMGSSIDPTITLPSPYASGELIRLFNVGPWNYHDFPAIGVGAGTLGPTSVPYDTAMNWPALAIARPLQKITTQDRLVALRYVGNDLTGAGEIPAFDMAAGANTVSTTMTAVPHAPLDVTIQPAAIATRLGMTTPQGPTVSMVWSVVAAPAWQYGNNNGPQLQAAGIASADNGHITAMYGNPFVGIGWKSLFVWATNRSRVYTVPSLSLPVTAYAGLNVFDEPTPGLQLDQPAGLPVLVSINKMPLTSDGLTAMLDPTKPVELSLVADKTSNAFYQFNVYELVPNTAMPPTALDFKIIYVASGPTATMTIPHDVFVTGKVYTVRAHCIGGGYPMIGAGNLQARTLPYSIGYLDSGVFTVAAP